MKNKTELLAPAGDYKAFLAAVENGADAVYLGGKLLNARQFAENFDYENLKKALEYAHIRGVSVYLAANTLVSDNEMKQALELIEEAYLLGIDGVIVQDLGFAGMIRRTFPDLNLHASTQMTIYNIEGVRQLEQLGFKRAVLARELSIEEIGLISRNTPLEIEVFVHGALCISYSGQCLMSSIIGGRSGNRGKCAQPCRLPYEFVSNINKSARVLNENKKGYLLSPRDICSIDILDKIINSGVKSLKIEGRMKSPEYVATVVRVYRKYLDAALSSDEEAFNYNVQKEDKRDLAQIFNRGGLSTGYLISKAGQDMMCFEKPKNWGIYLGEVLDCNITYGLIKIKLEEQLNMGDGVEVWNGEKESPGTVVSEIKINGKNVKAANCGDVVELGSVKGNISVGNKVYKTSDKKLNMLAKESFEWKPKKRVSVEGKLTIKNATAMQFVIGDDLGNTIRLESAYIPQKALNKSLTKERLTEQINKTGDTPFRFQKIEIVLEEDLSVPISEINDIRRRALDELEKKRAAMYQRKMSSEILEGKEDLLCSSRNSGKILQDIKVSVYLNEFVEDLDYQNIGADRIYLPFSGLLAKGNADKLRLCRESGAEVFIWLPSITRGNYDSLIKRRLKEIIALGIDGILIGNLGMLELVKEYPGIRLMGDFPLNIFNSLAIDELYKLELIGLTLSPELNLNQISHLIEHENFIKEAVAYGRLPLMTSEYCPAGSISGGFSKDSGCNLVCVKGVYKLRDRMGMEFPVICDKIDCRSTILNSNVLMIIDDLEKLKVSGIDMIRINITVEDAKEVKEIVEMHRAALKNGASVINKYNGLIEQIKRRGFTRGHYFKGV